ncbi:tRNA (adenosine(37)-N6)-threonylcarbamoyltransferase complex dimerization subunit type 1 TsaB [Ectothiorhodospiraceae bacterium 2226]|nr:tRNA (adenosine(37)-N6)-threonylcarbamoyltransferase complex dimerization subunit type 1 TsaB [Ectothiorhodospiraceae bacterium 2226]
MKLLALDTSTEACSAALLIDDTLTERYRVAPREHGQLILSMAEELLAEAGVRPAELDALAVTRGPGGFTGLRIGIGVAQGIAFAADLPVVTVSTLAALAQGAWREHQARRVIAAIDARMQEVYVGLYALDADEIMRPVVAECVCAAAAAPLPLEEARWLGVGTGFVADAEVLAARYGAALAAAHPALPRARDVAVLGREGLHAGEAVAADAVQPVYLRDEVARPKVPPQSQPNKEPS